MFGLLLSLAILGAVVASFVFLGGAMTGAFGRVHHLERAAGLHPQLHKFLAWWDENGSHEVEVAPGGGVRTQAEQAIRFANGETKAAFAHSSAHGRGAGLDVWPLGWKPYARNARVTPDDYQKLLAFGKAAEEHGFRWGGRWESFAPTEANPYGGDLPHIEMPGWTALPYPPSNFGTSGGVTV